MRKIVFIVLLVAISTSCSSSLYSWKGYDKAMQKYTIAPNEKSEQALVDTYQKLVDNPTGTSKTPPPGVAADLGYLLIESGRKSEGLELLRYEKSIYPESTKFIDYILKRYEQ